MVFQKAIVLATLALSLGAQAQRVDRRVLAQGNNNFGARVFEAYKDDKKANQLISPYSAQQALLMLMNGGKGETLSLLKKELVSGQISLANVNAINKSTITQLNSLAKEDRNALISVVNSVWVDQDFKLLPSYQKTLEDSYLATAKAVDMNSNEAVKEINAYVAQNTKDPRDPQSKPKIPSLLKDGDTQGAALYLVNTTYIKAAWSNPFEEVRTSQEPFRQPQANRSVKVAMMKNKGNFKATHINRSLQAVELPLGVTGSASVVILLPFDGNVEGLKSSLTRDGALDEALSKLSAVESEYREVWVPKTKIESSIDLRRVFETMSQNVEGNEMKLRDLFTSRVDLTGIADDDRLVVSQAIQKTILEMDETGIEAAAATGIGVGRTSVPPQPVDIFKVDRPFVILIKENKFNNVLFLGSVTAPETK